jgi:hypothetical protein
MIEGDVPDDSVSGDPPVRSFKEKLQQAFLKPAKAPNFSYDVLEDPQTVEEIEDAIRSTTDRERLIGLVAAPLAAAITILITGSLISNDPPAFLKSGAANRLHTSVSLYQELGGVLVVISILILALALWRKRVYLGIALALFGLAVFNLHFWGFGVPYILAAAWYLVRAYRLQRTLREATGGQPRQPRSPRGNGREPVGGRPGANKRYTPPTASRRWTRPVEE